MPAGESKPMSRDPLQEERDKAGPLTVSQLTEQIKDLLEGEFSSLWVCGEISNFSRPQSGHCYLTLKDEGAQLRAVIWRGAAAKVDFKLQDGLEVVCFGNLDVYAPRGSYQLVIRQVQPLGLGALEQRLRRLREKLAAEGLFDPDTKRELPPFPRTIAVVTSPTGAAIRDFLQVLRRRWRDVRVIVLPVRVQGDGAAEEIAAAIEAAGRLTPRVDTLVVTRGGGSLEDLWAFNEEVVVRAIHASPIPVISGVGHEIDVTLGDLAADVRALTPSEAAELIVPAAVDVAAALGGVRMRLAAALRARATQSRLRLERLADRRVFRQPYERVHDLARRLDELGVRGREAMTRRVTTSEQRLATASAQLESLSPLAVLGRGYSLTTHASTGQVVRAASELAEGDKIVTRFADGEATSRVEDLGNKEEH